MKQIAYDRWLLRQPMQLRPVMGWPPSGVSIVACTSTMQMGPGVVVVQCLLARHCQLARAQKWSH